ncbi:MAG: hypothetical protein HRT68_14010 [Flavobacteriaceae bacterium]|nr:hypothetical protein [Flavobacteriaceae bacterium]
MKAVKYLIIAFLFGTIVLSAQSGKTNKSLKQEYIAITKKQNKIEAQLNDAILELEKKQLKELQEYKKTMYARLDKFSNQRHTEWYKQEYAYEMDKLNSFKSFQRRERDLTMDYYENKIDKLANNKREINDEMKVALN